MSEPKPPGVFDILPNDTKEPWRSSHLWQYVETKVHETARDFGYREIRTPIFERTEIFERGIGEGTDIVSKEMYTFKDRGDRSLTLRPEGTASVVRAFIENNLYNQSPIHKFYYIGPMFRYERQQAGRYRQLHQFGVEVFGVKSPDQDVEIIDLAYTLYQRLGLKNLSIVLNNIGNAQSRSIYREKLREYFRSQTLSEDSIRRLETNPLRILDSKDAKDQAAISQAPSILDFLNEESIQNFEQVKKQLKLLKIPFELNPKLIRGLDYYNDTVFEVISGDLGAQNSVCGGGRFDSLLKTLGGPDIPAVGFATGIERLIQTMLKQNVSVPEPHKLTLFVIPLGESARDSCMELVHQLRQQGIACDMDYSGRKLGKVMQYADSLGTKYVTVIGDQELQSGQVQVKEMASGQTTSINIKEIIKLLTLGTSYV